jgi:putative transposase
MTDDTKAVTGRQRKLKGPFSDELLDQLLTQVRGRDAESLLGESRLIGQLKKQPAERMLGLRRIDAVAAAQFEKQNLSK